MLTKLLIVGAGGHAKVVADACLRSVSDIQLSVVDDDPEKQGEQLLGTVRIRSTTDNDCDDSAYHIAIGDNAVRCKLAKQFQSQGRIFQSVFHPAASVSTTAEIEAGCFVAAVSVVGPDAHIGRGVIINHGAVVDHDCMVGAFSHIAPNATLGGNVKVGRRVLIGAGAVILPGVVIGDDAVVGAGAVVTAEIKARKTVIGIPGKVKE